MKDVLTTRSADLAGMLDRDTEVQSKIYYSSRGGGTQIHGTAVHVQVMLQQGYKSPGSVN